MNATATTPSIKRALVTGASGGLGSAIARRLARDGLHVIVHANSRIDAANALADELRAAGASAEACAFDITDRSATQAGCEALLAGGPIQVLVNNAGTHDDAAFPALREAQWHKVIDVSLNGFFNVTQALIMPMIRTRWGRVINISSMTALAGNRGQVNYAAAKSALHGASRSLAREMASRGITVNAVAPGLIAGRMAAESFDAAQIKALVPAGRAGTPDEVAALVRFLCSDAAGYINGQVIGINGGMG
jgi:3-oxoacyl-[acyl-carrier protein] reductase